MNCCMDGFKEKVLRGEDELILEGGRSWRNREFSRDCEYDGCVNPGNCEASGLERRTRLEEEIGIRKRGIHTLGTAVGWHGLELKRIRPVRSRRGTLLPLLLTTIAAIGTPRICSAFCRSLVQASRPQACFLGTNTLPSSRSSPVLHAATSRARPSRRGGGGPSPAEEVQWAQTPSEILDAWERCGSSLAAEEAATALLRVAKALLPEASRAERAKAAKSPVAASMLQSIVDLSLLQTPNGGWGDKQARRRRVAAEEAALAAVLLGLPILQSSLNALSHTALAGGEGGGPSTQAATTLKWAAEALGFPPSPVAEAMTKDLPFRVMQGLVKDISVGPLLNEVAFRKDEIVAASGAVVHEQRGTAWLADQPTTTFPYSGKVMSPSPMTSSPSVAAIRDTLRHHLGIHFDGCLLNYYPDGNTHIRYHSDPDQGTLWTNRTCVVSTGDARLFSLRNVIDHDQRHQYVVREGDCVYMFDSCQEDYQHAILKAWPSAADATGARVSLVFKESLGGSR